MKHLIIFSTFFSLLLLINSCGKEDEVVPTSMNVNKIDLESWALTTSSGNSWDPNGGRADLFLTLATGGISSPNSGIATNSIPDIEGGIIYSYENLNWNFTSINSYYAIGFYDDETPDSPQKLYQISFTPEQEYAGLPATIIVEDGPYRLKLYVTWTL